MACTMTYDGRKHDYHKRAYCSWMEDRSDIFIQDVTRTVIIEPCPEYDIVTTATTITATVTAPSVVVQSVPIWEKIKILTNLGELIVNIVQLFM